MKMKVFALDRVMSCAVFLPLILTFCAGAATARQSSASSTGTNFDGPAELPREYVSSSLKDTPAAGKSWSVSSGPSLVQALASASCGDTIQLQAGATFTGTFVIPNKPCDDAHWILLRTSAPDSSLPAEETRLTPCYAGVANLPGRPKLNCASTANVLARIEFNGKGGSGPIVFSPGANHYRLIGLEVTRTASPGCVYNLIEFKGPADHVVFDRSWIHGTAQDETVRGIFLGASRYVAVVDSFFTDFHCVAKSGSCSDAQAIAGGIGAGPMGPYKITNNFLEASGENILFGGGRATEAAADIEVSRNHMFKPLTWMMGQPGFVGGTDGNPFIVKNLFELKSGQRVLLDGNLMENSWGGFSQVGFAILLTPKNPGGNTPCPACQVTDVTIRYNSIRHVGAGFQIANVLSDYGGAAADGQRYSIHDVILDDIDGGKYGGPGEFAQISVNPGAPLLQNLTINHVTAFPSSKLFMVGAVSTPMKNFVFSNNIVNAGMYPIQSTGGGPANCAYHPQPLSTLNACFKPYSFVKNAVFGSPATIPPGLWPSGNFFPDSPKDVRFVNYSAANGGDYHLHRSSRYRGAGTDGKDLGADVDAIQSATAAVE